MKYDKDKFFIILCSIASACFTWFINHKVGLGPIIASGLVGVIVAIILPSDLGGAAYSASFVGMSSLAVLPSISAVALGGFIVGVIIIATKEIYVGVGGKGGTMAATATLIATNIRNLII